MKTETQNIYNQKLIIEAQEIIKSEIKKYTRKTQKTAENLLNLIVYVEQNKSIHSHHKIMKSLSRFRDKLKKENILLIEEITGSYQVDNYSKEYKLGKFLQDIKEKIIKKSIEILEKKDTNQESEGFYFLKEYRDKLEAIDILKVKRIDNKGFYIPLNRKRKHVYFQAVGREYNTFNLMKSYKRKYTDFPNEYDLSSSVQYFLLNQYSLIHNIPLHETKKKFKYLTLYIKHKKLIRKILSKEINEEIDFIKIQITKLTFQGKPDKRLKNNRFIIGLQNDIKIIEKDILELINRMDNRLPIKQFIEINTQRKKEEKKSKSKSFRSKLFFYYEYREGEIRDIITEYLNQNDIKCVSVHDAIYTNKKINKSEIEQFIKFKSGLELRLD